MIHNCPKGRLGFIKLPPHVDMLRALAGKHEDDGWIFFLRSTGDDATGIE